MLSLTPESSSSVMQMTDYAPAAGAHEAAERVPPSRVVIAPYPQKAEQYFTKKICASACPPYYKFTMPSEFALREMPHLINQEFFMVSSPRTKERWKVLLTPRRNKGKFEHTICSKGWKRVADALSLKEGDVCRFEMLDRAMCRHKVPSENRFQVTIISRSQGGNSRKRGAGARPKSNPMAKKLRLGQAREEPSIEPGPCNSHVVPNHVPQHIPNVPLSIPPYKAGPLHQQVLDFKTAVDEVACDGLKVAAGLVDVAARLVAPGLLQEATSDGAKELIACHEALKLQADQLLDSLWTCKQRSST